MLHYLLKYDKEKFWRTSSTSNVISTHTFDMLCVCYNPDVNLFTQSFPLQFVYFHVILCRMLSDDSLIFPPCFYTVRFAESLIHWFVFTSDSFPHDSLLFTCSRLACKGIERWGKKKAVVFFPFVIFSLLHDSFIGWFLIHFQIISPHDSFVSTCRGFSIHVVYHDSFWRGFFFCQHKKKKKLKWLPHVIFFFLVLGSQMCVRCHLGFLVQLQFRWLCHFFPLWYQKCKC